MILLGNLILLLIELDGIVVVLQLGQIIRNGNLEASVFSDEGGDPILVLLILPALSVIRNGEFLVQ